MAGRSMAKSVRSTSINNKYAERKWWLVFWWGPNFFFTARKSSLVVSPTRSDRVSDATARHSAPAASPMLAGLSPSCCSSSSSS